MTAQIIECPHCHSKVGGVVIGELEFREENYPFPQKAVLVGCPACKNPLLGLSEELQVGYEEYAWQNLYRVWPPRHDRFDQTIPEIVQISLSEAQRCFASGAYMACAVMCGRAIEGLCVHHTGKQNLTLAKGLVALKESGVIDTRLFSWGDALRVQRNLGAHATTERVSKEDAQDLLDFATAICEYVFVLNEKFSRFQARQKKSNPAP